MFICHLDFLFYRVFMSLDNFTFFLLTHGSFLSIYILDISPFFVIKVADYLLPFFFFLLCLLMNGSS